MEKFKEEAERRYMWSEQDKKDAYLLGAKHGYQQGIEDRDELTRKAFYWKDKHSSLEKENESLKQRVATLESENIKAFVKRDIKPNDNQIIQ